MSKKSEFIKYAAEVFEKTDLEMNDDAKTYWMSLQDCDSTEKPVITDNGKLILKWLQENTQKDSYKSKEIAEGLLISSRSVSGAMRKLADDGFVEKLGKEPILYSITQKGKNFQID